MAGEWIKLDRATPEKPEVFKIARILGIDADAVVGKLLRLWAWIDSVSVDGVVDGVVDADVDRICRKDGFAAACVQVGWLVVDNQSERVSLPNFDNHNGETAKQRALKNRRQAKWRAGASTETSTRPSTAASTREEKRREEKDKSAPANADVLCGIDPQVASDFRKLRAAKRAALTQTAVNGIAREAEKAGMGLEAALRMCCERGWTGFKAEWVKADPAMPTAYDELMRRVK